MPSPLHDQAPASVESSSSGGKKRSKGIGEGGEQQEEKIKKEVPWQRSCALGAPGVQNAKAGPDCTNLSPSASIKPREEKSCHLHIALTILELNF